MTSKPDASSAACAARGLSRTRAAAETLELVEPLSHVAGVTRVGVISGLDSCPMFVVTATRPLSFSLSVTQGKGATLVEAKVAAIMEAIEHYHAETVSGFVVLASQRELPPQETVECLRIPGLLPAFNPDRRVLWVAGVGLVSGTRRWVPLDSVHYDLRVDGIAAAPSFVPNSNGLAAGNSLHEAVAFGLFEVVERHLTEEFFELSVEEQEQCRLDQTSISDPELATLLADLEAEGLACTLWDISRPTELPCFLCELVDAPHVYRAALDARGFGCHVSPVVALSRAIHEAVQARLTLIAGARDDKVGLSEPLRRSRIAMAQQQWRYRNAVKPTRQFQVESRSFSTFESACHWIGDSLVSNGFGEPVVVDLSKPGWPVNVVRVIAPGLRFSTGET